MRKWPRSRGRVRKTPQKPQAVTERAYVGLLEVQAVAYRSYDRTVVLECQKETVVYTKKPLSIRQKCVVLKLSLHVASYVGTTGTLLPVSSLAYHAVRMPDLKRLPDKKDLRSIQGVRRLLFSQPFCLNRVESPLSCKNSNRINQLFFSSLPHSTTLLLLAFYSNKHCEKPIQSSKSLKKSFPRLCNLLADMTVLTAARNLRLALNLRSSVRLVPRS